MNSVNYWRGEVPDVSGRHGDYGSGSYEIVDGDDVGGDAAGHSNTLTSWHRVSGYCRSLKNAVKCDPAMVLVDVEWKDGVCRLMIDDRIQRHCRETERAVHGSG